MNYIISAFADEASSSFAEQMKICAENSIRWVEVRGVNGKNISDLTLNEVKGLKKEADAGGVYFSSIGSPFGKIGVEERFEEHLDKFKKVIEFAKILEVSNMRFFSFFMPKDSECFDYKEKVLERISEFVENADGVTLCHENEKGIYGDNAERCREIFYYFEGKIKLIFDPANYIQCGVDIVNAYKLLRGSIEYFHIKDSIYKNGAVVPAGYGDGQIEWLINEFYADNKDTDRNVFLSIEPHLKVFQGFSELESEDSGLKNKFVYESSEKAFTAAVVALKSILCANTYTQSKDIERGCGLWTK